MKRTRLAVYIDNYCVKHKNDFISIKPNTTIQRLYKVYMAKKAYQKDLFWYWVTKVTPEELELEFNSHEIMELLTLHEEN